MTAAKPKMISFIEATRNLRTTNGFLQNTMTNDYNKRNKDKEASYELYMIDLL